MSEKVQTPKRDNPGGLGPSAGFGGVIVKPKDFKQTSKKLLALLKQDMAKLIFAAFFAVASVICTVLGPKTMALATNKLQEGMMAKLQGIPGAAVDFVYIEKICIALLALFVGSALLNYGQQLLTVALCQGLVRKLRTQISEKLDRLPLAFFDKQPFGEILSRITIDVDLMSTNLQQILSQLLTSIITIIGILWMMFSISWILACVSIVAVPLTFAMMAIIGPRAQKYFKLQQKQLGELNGQIEENYSGHGIIKAFNRERASIEKFNETNNVLFDSAWRAQFISSAMFPLTQFITNLQYVVIVVVAALLSASGKLPIGDILAFIQYVQQFGQPLTQTAQISSVIQGTVAAAERVFSLLEAEEMAVEPINGPVVSNPTGNIELRGVSFDYSPDKPLIRDLSLHARSGQKIAIVGPTGAGKTTIVNLLMRFYEIAGGEIDIDGVNAADMAQHDVRKLFGMVLQDTWLFSGTIRENIAYGREDASDDEIVSAAKTALADHFIRTLPDGYDTVLHEDATNLSVGQRQLLTIARAVLADAPILILDEATSSVDTRTEQLIQTAMNRLMEGRTSFVIAHRLSTIRDADTILVMNEGRVVESGNHDELLRANGFYSDLYHSQFTHTAA